MGARVAEDFSHGLRGRVRRARLRGRKRSRARRAERAQTMARGSFPPEAFGPPDFVGVGAQRSGTRWWYTLLLAHPQVYRLPGALKECHFFDDFWRRPFAQEDVERYRGLFPRPPGAITGEWTPSYMLDVWAPALLRRAAPDARLLVVLRDPVERFRSGIRRSLLRQGMRLELVRDAFARGLYHAQLMRLLDEFERERILVLQYERCLVDTESQLEKTYAFLGLDTSFVPSEPGRRVKPKSEPLPLPEGLVSTLRACYRDDVRALVNAFPEIDPALWPTAEAIP